MHNAAALARHRYWYVSFTLVRLLSMRFTLSVYRRKRWVADCVHADIDAKNLEWAAANVKRSGFNSRVRVIPTQPSDPLLPLDQLKISQSASLFLPSFLLT